MKVINRFLRARIKSLLPWYKHQLTGTTLQVISLLIAVIMVYRKSRTQWASFHNLSPERYKGAKHTRK